MAITIGFVTFFPSFFFFSVVDFELKIDNLFKCPVSVAYFE